MYSSPDTINIRTVLRSGYIGQGERRNYVKLRVFIPVVLLVEKRRRQNRVAPTELGLTPKGTAAVYCRYSFIIV